MLYGYKFGFIKLNYKTISYFAYYNVIIVIVFNTGLIINTFYSTKVIYYFIIVIKILIK